MVAQQGSDCPCERRLRSTIALVGWQSSLAARRMMCLDIEGELGNIPDYSAIDLDELAMGIVDMVMNGSAL